MKYFLLLFILPFALCAQPSGQKGLVLRGIVQGLSEGDFVCLIDVNNAKDTIGKASVKNGEFLITGKVKEPNLMNLEFPGGGNQRKLMLFAGNDSILVVGDIADMQRLKVGGSASHNDFIRFQQVFNPLFQRLNEMNQVLSNPAARNDSAMQAYQSHLNAIQTAIDNFIGSNSASPLAPFTLAVTTELSQDISLLEKRYAVLDNSQKNSFYGRIIRKQIDDSNIGAVGSKAAGFVQNDTAGVPVSLESFKGKYVLIDFWASWCRPCRMENPNVVNAYNRFKAKNFTVLGVSLDRTKADWMKAIKDDQLTWTHVSDLKFWSNEVAQQYKVQSIPQNFLIDPDGKIIAKNLRGGDLINKLCEFLGCE